MLAHALLFLCAVLLVQQLEHLPNTTTLFCVAVLAMLLAGLRYWRSCLFVLAMLWTCFLAQQRLDQRLTPELEGEVLNITGTVLSLPDIEDRRISFEFAPDDRTLPRHIKLSWYDTTQNLKAGQHWSFSVKLKQVHGSLNPNGFDYEKMLFMQNIGATGYVKGYARLLGQESAWFNIQVLRQRIADKLSSTLKDKAHLALIKALTIGDGSSISAEDWQVFRKTGTTHLIVISGSHVGLIAGLVYWLLLKTWAWTGILRYSPPKVAAFGALCAALFYSALAGFSTPTQRAAVMVAVAMLALLSQRNPRPLHTLACALLAVLMYDPFSVLAAGFWLSFIAVALIIYLVSHRLAKLTVFFELIKLNSLMSLALAPLTLLFFQQVSIIASIANLIAVPVLSFLVVPLALLATLLLFITPDLANLLFIPVNALLNTRWLELLAKLPLASLNHAQPSLWALVCASLAVLLLLAPKGIPARVLGLLLLLPLLFNKVARPAHGTLNLTVLDVGQGLSVALHTATHDLVYDTGAKFSATSDQGKNVVLPFLAQAGIDHLDTLIISHGDNDHIGGADSLLQNSTVQRVLSSVPEQLTAHAETCLAGQTWTWDGVEFLMLSPFSVASADNNHSCVLLIKTAHGNVLLTGDIEQTAEQLLVKHYAEQLQANILLAPHHGSHTSSSLEFLHAVDADTVLISSGYRNSYHHPHADVLQRYQQLQLRYFNTANDGAINVQSAQGIWSIQTERALHSHYWNFRR